MSNQADTMESEASTVRIDSTSSSRVNSFKAEMAANRAAARDGLTLDSPKDENGATRRYDEDSIIHLHLLREYVLKLTLA